MAESSLTINPTFKTPEAGIGRAVFNSDAMEPTIIFGDVIEVDHSQDQYSGDGIYCFSWRDWSGEALILRRVIRQLDGTYDALNDNKAYPSQKLTEAELAKWPMRGRVVRSYSARAH